MRPNFAGITSLTSQVQGLRAIMERPLRIRSTSDGRDLAEITRPDLESFGACPRRFPRRVSRGLKELSLLAGVVGGARKRPALRSQSSFARGHGRNVKSRCARPRRGRLQGRGLALAQLGASDGLCQRRGVGALRIA